MTVRAALPPGPLGDGAGAMAIDFDRIRRQALIVGVFGLLLLLIGAFFNSEQFFRSYLVAYLFWFGIAMGCLGLALVHHLAGGRWSAVLRRLLESGAILVVLMAVLFVPLLFGLPTLYLWARPDAVAADPALLRKAGYLNVPFFILRAVFYFVIWFLLVYFISRWSREQDRTADPRLVDRLQALSAPGVVIFALTLTFALFDWVMSLEPHWYSTIFGAMVGIGQVLGAYAFVVIVTIILSDRPPLSEVTSKKLFNDYGSLMLAIVMGWAYLSFSQMILIYAANLKEEIPWYLRRIYHGWQWYTIAIMLFNFAVPFSLLLIRPLKRNARLLAMVAALLFIMCFVILYWLVVPGILEQTKDLAVNWLDIVAPIGIGGIWIAAFLWRLEQWPLLAPNEPKLRGLAELKLHE